MGKIMKSYFGVNVRYICCFTIWLTLFTFYTMRSNISIAMLAMTKQTTDINSTSYSSCLIKNNMGKELESHIYEFTWTQTEQGYVLSSFFIGYFSTHLLGSFLSLLIGPRKVMIICLLGSTIFTFGMVFLPYFGIWYFVMGRIMIGFFSGPLYPIVHELIANYAPLEERTILTVLTHTGNLIGLSFNFGVGGYIVDNFDQGWKYLFIMNGALGVLAFLLWFGFVYSSPSENPLMGNEERIHILESLGEKSGSHRVPFKDVPFTKILTSRHVYIVCFAGFGNSIILYAQLTGHPKYLSSVFGVSKAMASYLSIIPFMSNFVFQILYPLIFDYSRFSHRISKTSYRRITSAIAFFGSAIFLAPVGFVSCDRMSISILLVTLSMVFLGANQSGFFTGIIDLSPRYSGIIMALSSCFGSFSGILQPQITSYLIKNGDRKEGYMLAFIITSIIAFLTGVPYILFGTCKVQKWNNKENEKSKIDENTKLLNDYDI